MKKKQPGKGVPRGVRRSLEPYVEEAERFAAEFLDEAAARFQEEGLEVDLDAVRHLDRICRFNREAFDEGLVLKAGFFFGEILRATYGGRYQWDARVPALALEFEGLSVYPVEKIRRLVKNAAEGRLEDYLVAIARKVAAHRGGSGEKPISPGGAAP